jgi:hypothetical protein
MEKEYCAYPRFHLQIKPNGMIKPCCRFDVEVAKNYSVASGKTLDTLSSEPWSRLRKEMKEEQGHAGCYKCAAEEALGIPSMRTNMTGIERELAKNTPESTLSYLEIGFGNQCNLACRTCGSPLSSRWYEDDMYLKDHFRGKRDYAKRKIARANFDFSNKEALKKLKLVKFTGGEPFLQDQFWIFLEELADVKNEECVLRICTNATTLPKAAHWSVFQQFKTVDISVSIDGYGSHNDYLRYPSKWKEVEVVLGSLKSLVLEKTGWTLSLCTTVSIYSVEAYADLKCWWDKFSNCGSPEKFRIVHQPVFAPSYLSPAILPLAAANKLLDDSNYGILKYFNGKLATRESLGSFVEFTTLLDRRRRESFASSFPRLHAALKDFINEQ